MLDIFAQYAKFSDSTTGQKVFSLLFKRKIKSLCENSNLGKEFIMGIFKELPYQAKLSIASNYHFSKEEIDSLLKSEESIKVINKLIERNTISFKSANELIARYGVKVLPGVYKTLKGDYSYFADKFQDLKGRDLMEFIFKNYSHIDKDKVQLIFTNADEYFQPNSYVNLLLSVLIDRDPALIETILTSSRSKIFDSTISTHRKITSEQMTKILSRLLLDDQEIGKYALMAVAANPGTPSEIVEQITAEVKDIEIRTLASKNLLKKQDASFNREKALYERALPNKFRPEGRVGYLVSIAQEESTPTQWRDEAIKHLRSLPDDYKLIKGFLNLEEEREPENLTEENRETITALKMESILSLKFSEITPSLVPQLSYYLEQEYGNNENIWDNFFTLVLSHEGTIGSLVETSRRL